MKTVTEIWPGAVEHDGRVPEDWVFEGMFPNDIYYFRLYRAPGGQLYYTRRKKPKERSWPRYEIHKKENGQEYARQRWRRKPFEAR